MNSKIYESTGTASTMGWLRDCQRLGRTVLFAATLVTLGGAAGALADESTIININTASAERLTEMLTGVGLAKAKLIVEYRELHGPFEHIDELQEVRGIGESTVAKNRALISLE